MLSKDYRKKKIDKEHYYIDLKKKLQKANQNTK